ncbi:beta-1,4-glucuronyltransferase 1-like isoform X1 [Bacillus rossius redtenbacheri]|uniref:beta-1,4-glucuronyltransferase 1-like isoform X1 n=1 Tax=Bacillus rossius redtenbacheri TaxID=93214 RepID=UPI002FDD6395
MQNFLWGKVVFFLVAVVAILQVVHLILLSQLEAKHRLRSKHDRQEDEFAPLRNEGETLFAVLVRSLTQSSLLDASGEYQVVPNLAPASRQPQRSPAAGAVADITLVTQCSVNHLHHLVALAQRWQGPISVSVFVDDHEMFDALRGVATLRYCYSAVHHNVSFHLVSPLSAGGRPLFSVPPDSLSRCDLSALASAPGRHNYAGRRRFPANLLRNVARRAAASELVLVADVDMLPSSGLRQDFYDFAMRSHIFGSTQNEDKTVWVVPAFESQETVPTPQTKAELLKLLDQGDVRPFYIELCWKCQVHTDYDAWQREPPSVGVVPLFEVLWKDPWEPFYITRNSAPFYDERFKQYGFNRISQVCELHVAGYKFSVLNNAFLVHRGLKTARSFHDGKDADQERNRVLFRQFKVELRDRYPESSRRCY